MKKLTLKKMSSRIAVFTSDIRISPADVERELGTLPLQPGKQLEQAKQTSTQEK